MYVLFLTFFAIFFAKFFSLFFSLMEGYSRDGKYRDFEGQIWSQNSKWIKFVTPFSLSSRDAPSRITQLQFQHRPNLFASHPTTFIPTSISFLEYSLIVRTN